MSGLGDSFRSAREAKGLTFDQIAQETRISVRFLQAIENEAFEALPGGLFNRGFIRTYASKLDLDPETAVRTYQALSAESSASPPDQGPNVPRDPNDRRAGPLALAGLIVMVVVVYAMQHQGAAPEPAPGVVAQPGIPPEPVTTRQAASARPATPTPVVPEWITATTSPDAGIVEPIAVNPKTPELIVSAAAAETEAEAHTGVSVEIQVHQETWVMVEADGRMVTDPWGVTLFPGTNQSYTANDTLELKIGNAAGITLNVNGREIGSLGPANQVRTLTITPENVGSLTGG